MAAVILAVRRRREALRMRALTEQECGEFVPGVTRGRGVFSVQASSWTPLDRLATQTAPWLPFQQRAHSIYTSDAVQWLVAALILANFVVSAS